MLWQSLLYSRVISYTHIYLLFLYFPLWFITGYRVKCVYSLKKYLFIHSFISLHLVLVVACRIFSCSIWDLVPWPRIELRPLALGAQNLSHWITREAPKVIVVQSLSCIRLLAILWTLYSMPGFLVHHSLPELTQTHVHWVGDAIQPSHPLSSPSPALNLAQHQGLFHWIGSSHQLAKVLELQHQSFQWILRVDFL